MHYNANMGGGGDHINLTGKYTTHGSKTGDILQPPTPSLSQHVHPCFQCQDSPSLSALLRLLLTMNVQYVTQKFPVIQVSLRGRWPHSPPCHHRPAPSEISVLSIFVLVASCRTTALSFGFIILLAD